MNRRLEDDTLEYLDSIAAIVASLMSQEVEEPLDDNQKALIKLGEAYLFLYNYVLNGENYEDHSDDFYSDIDE